MSVLALKTLVLTQGYEPVKVISWQRAITLLSLGKIEILHEHDYDLRSASIVIKCPSVVRLLNAFRKKKKPVKFSRVNIAARDKYRCSYCNKSLPLSDVTYDHVIPRSQGGETSWMNITSSCDKCNGEKAGRTPKQAGMKLLREPFRPKWVPSMVITFNQESMPDGWRDFLWWNAELITD